MIAKVFPGRFNGVLHGHPCKSITQRALALAMMHKGKTILSNCGYSNDDRAALNIIEQCGVSVLPYTNEWHIESSGIGFEGDSIFTAEESGLSARMFSLLLATSPSSFIMNGSGSLLNRPMDGLINMLEEFGVKATAANNKLPLQVQGPLQPKNAVIEGGMSSQYITGLFLAIAYTCVEPVSIKLTALKSRPYLLLTVDMLKSFGYDIVETSFNEFVFTPKERAYEIIRFRVENDWSSAANMLVAGSIAGYSEVHGLNPASLQADRKIINVLADANAKIVSHQNIITASKSDLQPFEFDATDCPDLFPPLMALAATVQGISRIRGLHRLATKESDRGLALKEEFGKLGVHSAFENDELVVFGRGIIKGGKVHSHGDHRIAMSLALAGMVADAPVEVSGAEAIDKSYPAFFEDCLKAGINITFAL